jgi:uncharacterized membrane protein YeaQ/YmgE (transglycosylase-associated protein family)
MLISILSLVVGGLVGLMASLIVGTDTRQGALLNVIVGIVGVFVAGLVLTPIFGISTINEGNFNFSGSMISLLGAIILLAAVNLFQRRAVR